MASGPGEASLARWRSRAGRLRRRLAEPRQPVQQAPAPAPPQDRPSGRAPDVALESTHLGPVLDEAVLRAKRRMRIGTDRDYDLLYENFDVLHYLLQAPELIEQPDLDLIEHFLENGREQGLSPHPDFSMSAYLERYPHKTAPQKVRNPFLYWLKHGRAAGDIADPTPRVRRVAPVLGLSPERVAELAAERRRDLQQRFRSGRLGEVFTRAAEIEPLIGATWPEIADPHLIPLSRPVVVDEICTIFETQEAAGFQRARVVLVSGRGGRGGGRGLEDELAACLAAQVDPEQIVVIHTDKNVEPRANGFPDGVREIDFARAARGLPRDRAEHALIMLLRTFSADAIVNIDSQLLHGAMRTYARALGVTERLFVCFFGTEQTVLGTRSGWSLSHFYRTFEHVAGVITDSEQLARELIDTYRVTEQDRERIHVIEVPVDADVPVAAGDAAKAFATRVAEVLLDGDPEKSDR